MQYLGPERDLAPLPCIRADVDDGVLTVALNRPAQRNTIDVALSHGMDQLLQAVAHDPAVRVLVLRGEGAGFCAGMDPQDFHDASRRSERTLHAARESANHWRVRVLRMLPQPVIAMVHGFCHGGALAILESCDIVLAADDAEFSIGDPDGILFPQGPLAKSVAQMMAPRAARYYALTGGSFDGREAERNGVASRSLPAAELEQETRLLAREFVGKDALALQFTKQALQHVDTMGWDGVLDYTAAKLAELKALQAGRPSTRAAAVDSFLGGKSKPGLGG